MGAQTVLCTAANDRFLDGVVTWLYSLHKNGGNIKNYPLYVIYSDKWCPLSEYSQNIIRNCWKEVVFHKANEADYKGINFSIADTFFAKKNENKDAREHYGKCIYLKMEAFKIGQKFDRLVWMDNDMLCLGDVEYLFNLNYEFAAAKKGKIEECDVPFINQVRHKKHYFNAGLYVATGQYLTPWFFDSLFETARKGHEGADQGAMHEWFNEHKAEVYMIEPRYNLNKGNITEWPTSIYPNFRDVHMLHLTGKKPWEKARQEWNRCDHVWGEYYDLTVKWLESKGVHLQAPLNKAALYAVKTDLMELRRHKPYHEYIEGNRVALVGPAETIQGEHLGHEIDEYDVVVRMNTVFDYLPLTGDLAATYGTRTDVLYLTRWLLDKYHRQTGDFADRIKANAIEYLVCANNGMHGSIGKTSERFAKLRRLMQVRGMQTRLRFADLAGESIRWWLRQVVGYELCGRTGFVALLDLLLQDPAELFVCGFSMYHGGGNRFREDCAPDLHPEGSHDLKRRRNHNSFAELEILRHMVAVYPNLKLDRTLTELVNNA